MTTIQCNYIYTYIKMQSQKYSTHWNSAATIQEMKERVLSPVNWTSDMKVLKGQCNTNINFHYLVLGLLQPSKMQFVTLSSTGYRTSTIFYESADKGKKEGSWKTYRSLDQGNMCLKVLAFFHVFLYKPCLSYRSRPWWP